MVQGWIRDVTMYQNIFADHQIMHFYRLLLNLPSFIENKLWKFVYKLLWDRH
jgi:hypothetical protein